MSKNSINNTLIIVAVGVVAVLAGFFGGMKYQESKTPAQQFGSARQGGGQGRFGGGRGGAVIGEILSSDDKTLTVKMQDGSSKIVVISSTTSINKAAQASKSDLKAGERVAVFGSTNSDGSVTAQSIQLNPMVRGGQRGGVNPTGTQ